MTKPNDAPPGTEIVPAMPVLPAEIERVLVGGDLAGLKPEQRVTYYNAVCKSLGLNPLTKPFEYITLNGKLTLYARKDATDQIRRIFAISVTIPSRETHDTIHIVTANATTPDGRTDESLGAVSLIYPEKYRAGRDWKIHPKAGKPLEGEERANAVMKAETKAKRRVTLSIVGMGFLDEMEVEDMMRNPDSMREQAVAEEAEPGQNFKIPDPIKEFVGGGWKQHLPAKASDLPEARQQIFEAGEEATPQWRAAHASLIDEARHILRTRGCSEWLLAKVASDQTVIEWPGDLWVDPTAYSKLLGIAKELTPEQQNQD